MKKIIHILIICALLFSIVQTPYSYASEGSGEEYALLTNLGIIKPGTDKFNELLTVEDFARMIVMLNNNGNKVGNTDFVQFAKDIGFIDDSTKAPFSRNTVAATLIKSVYREFCHGKEEQDVIKIGSEQGLFKSVSIADNSALTLGEAASLARNALEMKSVHYDGKTYKFDDESILEKNFEITEQDGVLYTGKMQDIPENCISIDNDIYETDKDYSKYGGYKVRAYVKEDKVVSIDALKFKNEIYIIAANDIKSVDSDSITFYKTRDKDKKILIDSNAKEIFNGRLVEFDYNDMNISNGFVTLIRHPGNSEYNVIVINQYDVMVAGGAGNNEIYGIEGSGMNVRLNPNKVKTTITLDGEEVELSEIKKYDVLTLKYTKQRDALDIEIIRNTISGTLEQWNSDVIKVGRKTYVKSAYFKKFAKQPELGSEIELLMDKSGFAVDLKYISDENRYGYFMGMYFDDEQDKNVIRILDQDGSRIQLPLKNKLVLNGNSVKADTAQNNAVVNAFKTLVECDTDGNVSQRTVNDYVYQVILYKTNSAGEVTYIDTAIEEPNEDSEEQLQLDAYINKNIKYKSGAGQFVDSFGITSDKTVIFRVPSTDNVFDDSGNLDGEKRSLANKNKHYEIASPSFIKNDAKVIISGYNISRGGLASLAVLYNEDLSAAADFKDTSMPLFVVTKVMNGIDPDGEICYILDGIEKNNPKRYYIKQEDFGRIENGSAEKIYPKEHDIMQIKAGSDGIVMSYTTRYSKEENKSYYERTYDEAEFGCISGYVTDKDENGFKIMSDLGTKLKERTAMNKGVTTYFVYDVAEKTMRTGSINDLVAKADSEYNPSQVFCTSSYGEVRIVIIYVDEEE